MTDEDEFFCPLPAQMDAGRQCMTIALSSPANGLRGPRQGTPGHVAISQSRRRPKRHGQSGCWSKDNVMAQAIREVAWNTANEPRKCPVKRGSREQKSPAMRLNAA